MDIVIIHGKNKNSSYLWWGVVSLSSYVISTLTCFNLHISYFIVLFQDFFLFSLVLKKNIKEFFYYYIVFLGTSFESASYFSDTELVFYGFKNASFFGISNNTAVLLFSFLLYFVFQKKVFVPKTKSTPYYELNRFAIISVIAVLVGFLNILLGDNGSSLNREYLSVYVGEVYYGLNTLLTLFFAFEIFRKSKDCNCVIWESVQVITGLIISQCIGPYLVYLVGIRGGYGGALLGTYSKSLIPFLILFPVYYKDIKCKWLIILSFVIGFIVPLVFFSGGSGKELLYFAVSVIVVFYYKTAIFFKEKSRKLFVVLAPIVTLIGLFFILPLFVNTRMMFSEKVRQLYSLINITSKDYLVNIQFSPQVRVYEVLSIVIEYVKKPWRMIFGKGFGGSISDYFNYFKNIPISRQGGVFSTFEFANEYYYRMHEIARIMLTYGLLGIALIINWIKKMIKMLSPLSILAIVWMLFFINSAQTLSCVLILAFVTSLYQLNNNSILQLEYHMDSF